MTQQTKEWMDTCGTGFGLHQNNLKYTEQMILEESRRTFSTYHIYYSVYVPIITRVGLLVYLFKSVYKHRQLLLVVTLHKSTC